MMRVVQLWQTGSVDTGMAGRDGQGALVAAEKPRRSAAGKHCPSPLDGSCSTLGQEAPPLEQLGSPVVVPMNPGSVTDLGIHSRSIEAATEREPKLPKRRWRAAFVASATLFFSVIRTLAGLSGSSVCGE
jgi:hypothetical protein